MSSEPRRVRLLEATERVEWGRLGRLVTASALLFATAAVGVKVGVVAVEQAGATVALLAAMPFGAPLLFAVLLALNGCG